VCFTVLPANYTIPASTL